MPMDNFLSFLVPADLHSQLYDYITVRCHVWRVKNLLPNVLLDVLCIILEPFIKFVKTDHEFPALSFPCRDPL